MDLSAYQANYRPINLEANNPKQQAAQQVAAPLKKKSFWKDQISTGGGIGGSLAGAAAGAALGSVVPVIGTALGGLAGGVIGGFAGGAGGQAVENKVTGSNDNIWKEGAINGILSAPPIRLAKGALVAKGAMKAGASAGDAVRGAAEFAAKPGESLLSKFTSKAGAKLNEASNDIAVKSLGLTKGQKNTLLSKTGQKASDIVGKYGIKTAEDIPKAVQPLFDEYATVVSSIPGTISKQQVVQAFEKSYAPMFAKGVPTGQKAIGEKLKAEAENLLEGIPETGITAAELNARKGAFDNLAYKLKASDPGAADINKMSRDALNELLGNFAEQAGVKTSKGSLKDLGNEINALKTLDKGARKNIEGAGGHTALGLTPLLGGGVGAGAAGPVGAVVGAGATKLLNSPTGQRVLGNTLDKGSSLLSKFKTRETNPVSAGGTVKRLAAAGAVGGLPEALDQASSEGQNAISTTSNTQSNAPINANMPELSNTLPNEASDPTSGIDSAIQQALAAGDYKGLSAILSVADYYEKKNGTKSKGLNSTASGVIADTKTGLNSLAALSEKIGASNANNPVIGALRAKNPFDTGSQNLQADISTARQIVGKALEGGVLRKEDEEKYKKILPTVGDTDAVASYKIQQLIGLIGSRLQEYQANIEGGSGGLDAAGLGL